MQNISVILRLPLINRLLLLPEILMSNGVELFLNKPNLGTRWVITIGIMDGEMKVEIADGATKVVIKATMAGETKAEETMVGEIKEETKVITVGAIKVETKATTVGAIKVETKVIMVGEMKEETKVIMVGATKAETKVVTTDGAIKVEITDGEIKVEIKAITVGVTRETKVTTVGATKEAIMVGETRKTMDGD